MDDLYEPTDDGQEIRGDVAFPQKIVVRFRAECD
jgi:hypothetical protein